METVVINWNIKRAGNEPIFICIIQKKLWRQFGRTINNSIANFIANKDLAQKLLLHYSERSRQMTKDVNVTIL